MATNRVQKYDKPGRPTKKKYQMVIPKCGSWQIVERQFVQGVVHSSGEIYYPSLHDLHEIHGVSYSTLRRRVLDQKWIEKREKWQEKIGMWTAAANVEDYVIAAQKFDSSCIAVAQKAMENILQYFELAAADSELVKQVDLDRLGRAAVNWQKVGRLSLGLSTENTAQRIQQQMSQTLDGKIDLGMLTENELKLLDSFVERVEKIEEALDETEQSTKKNIK